MKWGFPNSGSPRDYSIMDGGHAYYCLGRLLLVVRPISDQVHRRRSKGRDCFRSGFVRSSPRKETADRSRSYHRITAFFQTWSQKSTCKVQAECRIHWWSCRRDLVFCWHGVGWIWLHHLTKDTHSAKTLLHECLRLLFALVFSKLCFLHSTIGRLELRLCFQQMVCLLLWTWEWSWWNSV